MVKTPFDETDYFIIKNLVRQVAVLRPILCNCSLDQICKEGPFTNIRISTASQTAVYLRNLC